MEAILIIIFVVALVKIIFSNNELLRVHSRRSGEQIISEPNIFKKSFINFARILALFILIMLLLGCCSGL